MATNHGPRPVLGVNPFTDPQLEGLGNAIDTGLYVHTEEYPSPPVDHATFKAQLSALSSSIVAAADGGRKAMAEKKKQRAAFCKMVRPLGHYVEHNCKEDIATFLLSGFQPIVLVRTKKAVTVPTLLGVDNGNIGQFIVRARTSRNTRSIDVHHGVSVANALPAVWVTASFSSGRSMVLNDLTPGATYSIQVRAFGALGYSDWSDPVSRICM